MTLILSIAAGGAFGALARFFLNNSVSVWLGAGFPYGIFVINILGSFLMGVLVSYFAHIYNPSESMRAFLVVGFLGAFTTFSTYSLDAIMLIERGQFGAAALYIGGSVILAIGSLFAGMMLVRQFVS